MSDFEAGHDRNLNQAIKRARERKWIDLEEKKGKVFYRITPLGKKKINQYKFKELKILKEKWDGWWRVVIFDIPEYQKIARNALRHKLKYLGFFPLQKSVFVCPFKCEEQIEMIGNFYDISDNIELFIARTIGRREKQIRAFFGI